MGQAMTLASATSFKNCLESNNMMPGTEAPSTLRMPTSLVFCSTSNEASPNSPRQAAELRTRGVHESLWSNYAPYPAWTEPAMEKSPAEYDLYLIDFKRIEHKQTRTTNNPILNELVPANPL